MTNPGPSPVTAASVTDLFPVALVAPAWTCTADPGSSCAAASGTGNLATTVTLEAGDRATFIVTGLIAANATGLLVNTAIVTAPAGAVDRDTTNNTATSSVPLTPSANLHITKEGPVNAVAGTNVVYTITVTNAGPSDATGVTVTDPTPAGLTFVANAGDCTTAFPCNLGTLPPAATRTITATFAVPSGYTTPNPIANTATVSSPTPPAVSTSATTNTPVAAPVTDLRITKSNGVNGVVAGGPTTYTITVADPLGPQRRSGAMVIDGFPPTLTGVTWTCAGTGGTACLRGNGNMNTPVTVPVGASVVFTAGHGRSRRHRRTRQLGPGAPSSGNAQPPSAIATTATHRQRGRRRDRQTSSGVHRLGQSGRLHDHRHQYRAVGRRGPGGGRCRANYGLVFVSTTERLQQPPVRARRRARRRHPHGGPPRPSPCRSTTVARRPSRT